MLVCTLDGIVTLGLKDSANIHKVCQQILSTKPQCSQNSTVSDTGCQLSARKISQYQQKKTKPEKLIAHIRG